MFGFKRNLEQLVVLFQTHKSISNRFFRSYSLKLKFVNLRGNLKTTCVVSRSKFMRPFKFIILINYLAWSFKNENTFYFNVRSSHIIKRNIWKVNIYSSKLNTGNDSIKRRVTFISIGICFTKLDLTLLS